MIHIPPINNQKKKEEKIMKIGVQLYNFREAMKTDFKGTLKEVAKMGFDGVEFAGNYGGVAPDELAAYLKELKLECAGTMFGEADLLSGANHVYDYARALKSPAVTISMMLDFVKEYANVLARIRALGEAAKKNGCIFSYHNHWAEWAMMDGRTVMERLLDETDPQAVFFEPDVCWINRGGADAPAVIRKYAARIRQIHFKDIKVADDIKTTTPLGTGIIKIADCMAAAKEIDAQWCICEQDNSADPFKDAAISLKTIRSL